MNWYQIFYWLSVASNMKIFLQYVWVTFMIMTLIGLLTLWFAAEEHPTDEVFLRIKKWIIWSFSFFIVSLFLFLALPSKKDMLLIIAGGGTMEFLTSDESAKKLPSEITNFVITELQGMAQEAKVDLKINTQKEKILDAAKQMTTEELLNRMQVDSTFTKIVLNK